MLNMHMPIRLSLLCLVGLLLWANNSWAEPNDADTATASKADVGQHHKDAAGKEQTKRQAATIPDATHKPVVTTNSVTIAGRRVNYVAETGMLPLLNADGTLRASIFYVAYTRQGESNVSHRPLVFCFNGGPGAASVWLHLGALGPRRVRLSEDLLRPAPFGLVDNEFSILSVADLVFIDPVDTGYSRPAEGNKAEQFFGESPDIKSVGEFIQLWTTRNQRWLSPKYLCGESYGVFRAAGLAHYLHARYGMTLSGLIFVSGLLDMEMSEDRTCQVFLPAYTAAAHFHKKLPPDLQADLPKALAKAREFMRTEYAAALFQGASLAADQRAEVVAELARLTGLPEQIIEDNHLRIDSATFRKQLLHDEGLILGRFDARITGRDGDAASRRPDFDPSLSAIDGAFSAAMNAYVRSELKYKDDLPYWILNTVRPWKYEDQRAVMRALTAEMNASPQLRVLVLNGQCDLACPVDVIRYDINHMKLAPQYRDHIRYVEYEAGHMMYINLPDLEKMQKDLEQFIRSR
jgi:carboxypeptidase C (cathepsin A)